MNQLPQQPGMTAPYDWGAAANVTDPSATVGAVIGNPEAIMSSERLSQILHNSAISVHGWFTGREIPPQNRTGQYSAYGSVSNGPGVMNHAGTYSTAPEVLGLFLAAGIPETVSVNSTNGRRMGNLKTGATNPDEEAVAIFYEVTTEGRGEARAIIGRAPMTEQERESAIDRLYSYRAGTSANGVGVFRALFYMSASDARKWVAAVTEHPQLVHDTLDLAMHQEIQATKTWDQDGGRPPFDEWTQLNGGVNRIALRDDIRKGPDQSTVLES